MKLSVFCLISAMAVSVTLRASGSDYFIEKVALPTGQTVVVAEGEFEARSLGSFSVKLYEAAQAGDETTFFTAGLVYPRDGFVEQVVLKDISGDPKPEIIVVVRSAGTGGFLSAHAFSYTDRNLSRIAVTEGLEPDEDCMEALRSSVDKDQ